MRAVNCHVCAEDLNSRAGIVQNANPADAQENCKKCQVFYLVLKYFCGDMCKAKLWFEHENILLGGY